ncbi:unnamed protein product, partial [Laminaria digitata]
LAHTSHQNTTALLPLTHDSCKVSSRQSEPPKHCCDGTKHFFALLLPRGSSNLLPPSHHVLLPGLCRGGDLDRRPRHGGVRARLHPQHRRSRQVVTDEYITSVFSSGDRTDGCRRMVVVTHGRADGWIDGWMASSVWQLGYQGCLCHVLWRTTMAPCLVGKNVRRRSVKGKHASVKGSSVPH